MAYTFQEFVSNIEGFDQHYKSDITEKNYFGFPIAPLLKIEDQLRSNPKGNIAYFSMEFGIAPSIYNSFSLNKSLSDKNQFFSHEVFSNNWLCDYLFKVRIDKMLDIPIYGGGLGVLAGDTMKSAADEGMPVAGVGILWNRGYFKQRFWYKHGQIPEELMWDPHSYPGLIPLKNRVSIDTNHGRLLLRVWKYYVYSFDHQQCCPILLLDSNLPENSDAFRRLTDQLYRSDDNWWKILQRSILGIGGAKALDDLRYQIYFYHLNEGHAAFALVEKYLQWRNVGRAGELSKAFSYTCHTPVAAGHDRFPIRDVYNILQHDYAQAAEAFGKETPQSQQVNLTYICLNNCDKVNAVAAKHGEITRLQFPAFKDKIKSITNGIHVHTWISQSFQNLFDSYSKVFGDWRRNQQNLAKIGKLKDDPQFRLDLFEAHQVNKRHLMSIIGRWKLNENALTIGWARRIAGYKRPVLIFHNVKKLLKLASKERPLQIILSGKAHPNDGMGSSHIEDILDHIDELNPYKDIVKVLILENYDTYFGKLLTNCVDVWLNNPLPPFEASGTSGMKAIVNGVLQLSTLDGWVVEAADKDIGWIFGWEHHGSEIGEEMNLRLDSDSDALYKTLEDVTALYYKTNRRLYATAKDGQDLITVKSPWIDKMIHCVEQSAFFNTQRMVLEYQKLMWPLA